MLHFGTVGASFAMACLPLAYATTYSLVHQGRRGPWRLALLVVSVLGVSQWPPGLLMLSPLALSMLLSYRRITRPTLIALTIAVTVYLALFWSELVVLLNSGQDTVQFATQGHSGPLMTGEQFIEGWNHLLDHCRQAHPVILFLGFGGLPFLRRPGLRRWLAPPIIALACMTAWGPKLMPHLELSRMALPLVFAGIIPAALVLERLLRTHNPYLGVMRAFLVALLLLGEYAVSRVYGNKTLAPYVTMSSEMDHLVEWIRKNVPEHTRVMIAGNASHAFGGGHVAYLPMLTGREMMTSDYYAFPPQQVEYHYPPKPYRNSPEGYATFAKIYRVSYVMAYRGNYRQYLADHPDFFERVPADEVGTYENIEVYRINQSLPEVAYTVAATFNQLDVTVDDPEAAVVLHYNWLDGMEAASPVELYPHSVDDQITLVGVKPNGESSFAIRYER